MHARWKHCRGGEAGFNRVTKGVYEMGSTFKLFTAAMALDAGTVTLEGGYDASKPIRVARFTISDYHGKNRWLSLPEILVYSSNIGAAKMALEGGEDPAQLRKRVTSPGGTTEQAVQVLETGRIGALFDDAVVAAIRRAGELADMFGKK